MTESNISNQSVNYIINYLITKVFVLQPLASPRSAKNRELWCRDTIQKILKKIYIYLYIYLLRTEVNLINSINIIFDT